MKNTIYYMLAGIVMVSTSFEITSVNPNQTRKEEIITDLNSPTGIVQDGIIALPELWLNESNLLTVSITHTNILCNGMASGSATATASGGSIPYSYHWSNGGLVSTISNLLAGTYTVTVTDLQSATASATLVITQPPAIQFGTPTITNVSCFGENTGSIAVIASGGVPPYMYSWSNGSQGSTISNLAAGTYTVTATDQNICIKTSSYTINPGVILDVQVLQLHQVSCYGESDGSINLTTTGGHPPYMYSWSNGLVGPMVSGLPAGPYQVTVTDALNCSVIRNYLINQPPELFVDVLTTDETSNGANDGTATANASGGTQGYTYLWSNGGTTQMIEGLTPGTYTVTVTALPNNCTVIDSGQVNPFLCTLAFNTSGDEPVLFCDDITIHLKPGYITGVQGYPLGYLWTGGSIDSLFHVSEGGSYDVIITDQSNCSDLFSFFAIDTMIPMINFSIVNESSPGANDGAIVNSDADQGFTYLWSNGDTTLSISGLEAGEYCLTVSAYPTPDWIIYPTPEWIEGQGICETEQCLNVLLNNNPLNVTSTLTNVVCAGDSTGSISLTVAGGTPPYQFIWSTGDTSAIIHNLTVGCYSVTISDALDFNFHSQVCLGADDVLEGGPYGVMPITGNMTGSISISVIGGIMPFIFDWADPNGVHTLGTQVLSNLSVPGYYSVLITDSLGCSVTVDSMYVGQNVAIHPDIKFKTLKVYPVPSKEIITVDMESTISDAWIISIDGRVQEHLKNPLHNQFDVSDLTAGMYFLRVYDGSDWYFGRIVKYD